MKPLDIHDEWLSLIEVSGPFLATPVLKRVFSTGLPAVVPRIRQYLRQAYDEWCEARDNDDPRFAELHRAWIHEVLARGLEYDESESGELLLRGEYIPSELRVTLPEHGITLEPDYALVSGGKSQLLVQVYSAGTDLQAALKLDGWVASPAERMERLCRTSGNRLGLVTDGERWMLVDAPVGAVSTFASWYARLWGQERLTLQAFLTLLGIRRFFGPEDEKLPAMLDESLLHQEEVTDALGEQVRRAVEVLIQALDKEDRERSRTLLQGVESAELYEAGLTIMMRLVFLLSAEERGLLLMGEEAYESNYAISTLRMQLRKETEEVLERRNDAWARLLATFRAVYGGIEHEALRLPALGGSLFDPDRFPFLEGRVKGSDWRVDRARPLPIDNRTVLLLLEAIQQYEGRTLSYRALDVEQIGYVYEGLLERTVARIERVTVELTGGKGAKKTLYGLDELEALCCEGNDALVDALSGADAIKRGAGAIRKNLERSVDASQANRLLTACAGDEELRDRALPFVSLLRTDPWGYPLIYPEGAFIVTTGSDRRETGTHYTPKSLTEAIVTETLTPIAYVGPAEGSPREQWVLRSPSELLDLKICDPAMGSGAFLVQACRWLADRLVEAWTQVEGSGKAVSVDGEVLDSPDAKELLPSDTEARTVIARRLVAERCLYGVDLNPLAVELAKLSIWLVTLAKGRPFGFLDHNLRCGDSLLGLHRLDQLTQLSMSPSDQGQLRLFGQNIQQAVHEAIRVRTRLREMPIHDIRDVEAMASLYASSRRKLEVPECIADAFIGEVFASGGNGAGLENILASLTVQAEQVINGDRDVLALMRRRSVTALSTDLPADKAARRSFHWPLVFPEVFARERGGFDGIVGNPPFSGGRWIGRRFGLAYQEYLKLIRNGVVGSPDLCVYFYLRAFSLLGSNGCFGLLATKSITETGSRVVCLDQIIGMGATIYRGTSRMVWPGNAAVVVSIAWVARNGWQGQKALGDRTVSAINGALEEDFQIKRPIKLKALKGRFSQGQDIMGRGFELTSEERAEMLTADPSCAEVVFPLFNGQDLNTMPRLAPYRWVIYFRDWPEEQARRYGAAFRRVEELVKPYRESLTGQIHQDCFWKLWDLRPGLMREFAAKQFVLAIASVTKYLCVSRVPTSAVYNMQVKVLFYNGFAELAVLQSSLHEVWARSLCGTSAALTLRYSTSTVLETWPMPVLNGHDELESLGNRYHVHREALMEEGAIGLTQLYNRFHAPSDANARIEALRGLHREIDLAVARAYGWDDLDLEHGFHEVPHLPENDRVRFTISNHVRLEVLRRLSELNHQRYEEEVAQGLHGKVAARAPRSRSTGPVQPSLDFEAQTSITSYGTTPVTGIFGFLLKHAGWHAKADVLAATGIMDSQWDAAITELISAGKVERQGEKGVTRFRVMAGNQ